MARSVSPRPTSGSARPLSKTNQNGDQSDEEAHSANGSEAPTTTQKGDEGNEHAKEILVEDSQPVQIRSRNASAGPSRLSNHQLPSSPDQPNGLFDEDEDMQDPLSEDQSDEGESSGSVFELKEKPQPRAKVKRHYESPSPFLSSASGSSSVISIEPSRKRSRVPKPPRSRSRNAEVRIELPLFPISKLKSYYTFPGVSRPTQRSRQTILDDIIISSGSSSPVPYTRKGKRKARTVEVSDTESFDFGRWAGPDAEEDDEEEDYSEDGSDSVALRRSSRKDTVKARERERHRHTMRTRARRKDRAEESLSRIPEDDFYGPSSKRPAPRMPKTRRTKTKNSDSSGSDFVANGISEESDEVIEVDSGSEYQVTPDAEEEGSEDEAILKRHRNFCEKCLRGPANEILNKAIAGKKKPGKRRKKNEDELSDEELADMLEGWLECEKCVVSSHWGCLADRQRKDVLMALAEKEGPPIAARKKRRSVAVDEGATFICSRCTANPTCLVCHKETIEPDGQSSKSNVNGTKEMAEDRMDVDDDPPQSNSAAKTDGQLEQGPENDKEHVEKPNPKTGEEIVIVEVEKPEEKDDEKSVTRAEPAPLLFRCIRCRQTCHYEHLANPFQEGVVANLADIADHYQSKVDGQQPWTCHQCREWVWLVDIICAWRPRPAGAVEPNYDEDDPPTYKDPLPREYLLKWVGRGFRHVTWIPHAWAQAMCPGKLRHFLEKGPMLDLVTDETLAARGDEMAQPTIANVMEEDDKVKGTQGRGAHHGQSQAEVWKGYGPPPEINAESSIPQEWHTIDRVLDIMLLPPKLTTFKPKTRPETIGKPSKRITRILSASASPEPSMEKEESKIRPKPDCMERKDGVDPPEEAKMDIDTWEHATKRELTEDDVDEIAGLVTWCFVKWDDLQYDQSTWDTPPPIGSTLYPAFKRALKRYLGARQVDVPVLTKKEAEERDTAAMKIIEPPTRQPKCVSGGTLMPFQFEGFQWMLMKHFRRESCILADDMGLGKTIQIASLLGYLGSTDVQIYPCLVVVPNSTITNWVREFEKWVTHMRVVPYYGEASSRKIISKYELYHKGFQGKAQGLKAHVVLTTYDMITGNEFRVFSGIPRWEVLCVDEGQRLKSDGSLIFNRLKTLNSVHRILLTGTPLNNNLRELFNLLNFLDKKTFSNLEDLQAKFETLNEHLVGELHEMIKPYILRRIKADVLKLPPKVEIIVPISLAPLQKHVYKGILERNADLLKAIAEEKRKRMVKSRAITVNGQQKMGGTGEGS